MTTLLDRKQAAHILGVSEGTLANWHCSGLRKVPCVKIGARIRYREKDLERWIESQVINRVEEVA